MVTSAAAIPTPAIETGTDLPWTRVAAQLNSVNRQDIVHKNGSMLTKAICS